MLHGYLLVHSRVIDAGVTTIRRGVVLGGEGAETLAVVTMAEAVVSAVIGGWADAVRGAGKRAAGLARVETARRCRDRQHQQEPQNRHVHPPVAATPLPVGTTATAGSPPSLASSTKNTAATAAAPPAAINAIFALRS